MRVTAKLVMGGALIAASVSAHADWISNQRTLADLSKANTSTFTKKNVTVLGVTSTSAGPVATLQFNSNLASFGQDFGTGQDWSPYNIVQFQIKNDSSITATFKLVVQFYQDPNNYTHAYTAQFTLLPKDMRHWVITVNPDDPLPYGMKYLNPVLSTDLLAEVFGSSGFHNLNPTWHWRLSYQGTSPVSIEVSDARLIRQKMDFTGISDGWGQYTDKTWTGKIKANSDFAARLSAEKSDLAAHPGTGETLGSKTLVNPVTTLGKWTVVTYPNGMKFLQHPNGKLFWSLGMNAIEDSLPTPVQGRTNYFTSLASSTGTYANCYSVLNTPAGQNTCFSFRKQNLMIKYGSSYMTPWISMVKQRLASWGINTIGIDANSSFLNSSFPFVYDVSTTSFSSRIRPPSMKWGSLPDPFESTFLSWCESSFKSKLSPYVANQNLMGVFVDNELSWGTMDSNALHYNVALGVLKASSTQPAKVAFIRQLQLKYPAITDLNTSWGTNFSSFASMLTTTSWSPKYTSGQVADFQKYDTSFAIKYFSQVRTALQYAGLKSLYLGCRFADYTDEIVNGATGQVDVLSFNIYRYPYEVPFAYYNSLKKPVLISEFGFTLRGEGTFGGPASMPGSSGRANSILSFLQTALKQQNIIGAQYYCYGDQPITGRYSDYENGGFGAIDVADTPYQDTVNAFRTFSQTMYSTRGASTASTGTSSGSGGTTSNAAANPS